MLPQLDLPGTLQFRLGRAADYRRLAHLHYNPHPPATFALVCCVDYLQGHHQRIVAGGVRSYPPLRCFARESALHLTHLPPLLRHRFLNRHLRCISRLIVHPQFRGIGLSTYLVRQLCRQSHTRYVEAISRLAAYHPVFTRAGLQHISLPTPDHAPYFLWCQQNNSSLEFDNFKVVL